MVVSCLSAYGAERGEEERARPEGSLQETEVERERRPWAQQPGHGLHCSSAGRSGGRPACIACPLLG